MVCHSINTPFSNLLDNILSLLTPHDKLKLTIILSCDKYKSTIDKYSVGHKHSVMNFISSEPYTSHHFNLCHRLCDRVTIMTAMTATYFMETKKQEDE